MNVIVRITIALLLWVPIAGADLVVNFATNSTYVTVNQNGQGVVGGAVPWSLSNPRSPAANYSGPVYYGGATGSTAISAGTFTFANSTPDYINASAATGAGGDWLALVPMFTLGQTYNLTNLSLRARASGSATVQTNYVRLVIEQDGSLYVSDTNWYNIGTASLRTYSGSAISALSWYQYDPVNNLRGDLGALASGISPTNVTAVGVLLYNENVGATRAAGVGLSEFIAEGVAVVPEPSSVLLIGLGLSALFFGRARRPS